MIWGVICAVPKDADLNLTLISQLSAEDPTVWKPDEFLLQESIVEIVAFDSGYTLVKFKDKELSDTFKAYFQDEALDLQKFNDKYIS